MSGQAMTGRSVLDPHVCIFTASDGGYHVCHNYPSIPGHPDLNAFDLEDAVLRAAAGLMRLRGLNNIADAVVAVARETRKDSKAFDELIAPAGDQT